VYRSARQGEIDARQRLKARKSQADAAHLEATGGHSLRSLIINLLIYGIFHSRDWLATKEKA
jgi:hypothetical protein